jgi:hypothetical protein
MQYKKAEEPKGEKLVSIEGTGENRHLAKGQVYSVPQAEADALVASGRAKLSKESQEVPPTVPIGVKMREEERQITPDDVDNDAANKEVTDAEARARVDGDLEEKEEKGERSTKEEKGTTATKAASKKRK